MTLKTSVSDVIMALARRMLAALTPIGPGFNGHAAQSDIKRLSARESYGDDAIGYVQLQREEGICKIKCKVCPEHKVRTKAYYVTMIVNENDSEIISCQCHDFPASAGGCKHAVAFLMWAHRRSVERTCTSLECYWRKPTLSRVGSTFKYITVQQMSRKEVPHRPSTSTLYTEFICEAKRKKIENCELLKISMVLKIALSSNIHYTTS
ncbi:hypothetical protein EVAR_23173_1 [Eumeta japonica]|uniref:SWIM-type domain-containing protein n=1 Tax=Eumeta variegata TaxID=151549 RepID=A0A4C2AF08_EUMVA|nr:hypothetical protein EVAR_23173_1 [Eumeta japonica]